MRSTFLAMLVVGFAGCQAQREPAIVVPPPPTYRGPQFLRGTIGSVAELRNNQPVTVSGYGIVVGLDDTGSGDCPAFLRGWVLNEMRKGGFGQTRLGLGGRTAETELASGRVAVVQVEGVIPPGAPKGTRFDLRVSALPESSTTSLENGVLYSTNLYVDGLNPQRVEEYRAAPARGGGPIFINPFIDPATPADDVRDQRRIGIVLAGGQSNADAQLQLATTRPSLTLVRHIADRINQRLPRRNVKDEVVASPATESVINLRVPEQYRDDPQRMLDLVSHLFLDPRPQFTTQKAEEMAAILSSPAQRKYADDVAYAWEAMGKVALPIIRRYYEDPDPIVRMTALQAGARLQDSKAFAPLRTMALDNHGRLSEQATALLGELLTSKADPRGAGQLAALLRQLLDHDDPLVRLAAFDALAAADDASIDRRVFPDKMEVAWVQCRKPLIYVARSGPPRVVVFNDRLGFRQPMFFSMWDNRFMLKTEPAAEPQLSVFYRRPDQGKPVVLTVPATVSYLTGVMAFRETNVSRSPGLDFTYNRIITVLDRLTREGYVRAPLLVQQDSPADRARRRRLGDVPLERPETTEPVSDTRPVVAGDNSGDNGAR